MESHSPLTVTALGPIQDLLGAAHPLPWEYLRARELLLYLMCETRGAAQPREIGDLKGFTLQELGAVLLPGASDKQLGQTFKALFAEARRHVGAARIVFHNERYVFNFLLPCDFDVREFERLVKDARRLASGASPENAIPLFQQALALYRGDFMQGHTKRRSAQNAWDDDEREWYLTKREELRGARWDCLQQLGELLFAARRYREAVEVNRQLVAELDDDDDAHERILYALAAQGLKSEALRHFKQLRARRGENALDAKIIELIEKIKRNEILEEAKRTEGNTGNAGITLATNLPPPFQVPADLPRFVGRVEQFEILQTVVSQQSAVGSLQSQVSSLCLVGMGGIGKTSLAIHCAYALREHFPDGVLWGNLRESTPLAILASWERAYGCDFSGLPDLSARAASFRSLMHDKRVLVILDDVTDAADARPLLLNGAQTRTIFTTRSADIAVALDAFVIEMPALHADESADLLTRILGTARVAGQETFANEICNLLGNLPLALDITAHRLVSRPTWTLREMVERLRAQMRRLDELQLADRAVRATFALSWDALNDAQKNVLAHVGVFDARSFTADALAYVVGDVIASSVIAGSVIARDEAISSARAEEIASGVHVKREHLAMTSARDILDALVALSLVSFESSTRYRQHPLLADFSREKLESEGWSEEGEANRKSKIENRKLSETRLSEYYLAFATTNRKNYLALEDEWDNLNVGIEIAHAQEMWQAVIAYGDVLTDAWFARGRFTDARRNYPYVMRGARELEEQDPYINASLNWGKACIDQGDYTEAEEHLQHGLQTSREVNDEFNIANALFLLGRVSVERSEYDAAQKYLEESQAIRGRIGDRAGVAETLYMQGRIRFLYQDYQAARGLWTNALSIQEKLSNDHSRVITLRMMGFNETMLQNYQLAEDYSTVALSLAEKNNDDGEKAAALYGIAVLLRLSGRKEESMHYANRSLTLLEKMGDRKSLANINFLLSRIAVDLKNYDQGLSKGSVALALYRELKDARGVAALLQDIGDIHRLRGDLEAALQVWNEGLRIADDLGHPLAQSIRGRISSTI